MSLLHSRKGGAFPIMQSQFRRALGCMIARGQAQHLLKRRHYARPSPSARGKQAYQTAEDKQSFIVNNIDLDRKSAFQHSHGYARGRTSSPRDMIWSVPAVEKWYKNFGSIGRSQSSLVVRSIQHSTLTLFIVNCKKTYTHVTYTHT